MTVEVRPTASREEFTDAVFVESLQKLRKAGGKLYLTNLQPRVKGLLEIARLDSIFVLCENEDEAMKK